MAGNGNTMIDKNISNLYPFKNNFHAHTDGIKQHYVDEGDGQPFVMVHGNPSWSFLYRDMIKAFRSTHRIIAPDHIGCGFSDKPQIKKFPYRLADHIAKLEALINSFNFSKPIDLAVHDWGGAIGMGYATRNPDKIKRLVILNTGAFRLPSSCPFPWPLWLFRNTKAGAFLNKKFNAFALIASYTCTVTKMNKYVRQGFLAPYDCENNRVATTRFVQDIPLTPSDPSYSEILKIEQGLIKLQNKPTIVCFGRKDFVFNRHFYNEFKTKMPHAQMYNFNAGHYLLEDVGDKVFELIKKFFSNNP